MKKLMIVGAFVAMPLISNSALAEGCVHGGYAMQDQHNEKELVSEHLDSALLALLRKKAEEKAELEAAVITYN